MSELTTTSTDGTPPGEPRLRPIANKCTAASCPTVYIDAKSGTLVVQGFDVSASEEGVEVAAGESLVRVPIDLMVEALQNLS